MTLKIIENLFVFLLSVASVCDSLHYTTTRSTTTQRQRSRRQPLRLMPIEDLITSPFSSTVAADYVYTPPDVGVEIYAGTIIAVLPFIWASIKFGNRISIQRNCLVCKGNKEVNSFSHTKMSKLTSLIMCGTGSGLVYVTSSNTPLSRPRKCWSCGGILPWLGWKV